MSRKYHQYTICIHLHAECRHIPFVGHNIQQGKETVNTFPKTHNTITRTMQIRTCSKSKKGRETMHNRQAGSLIKQKNIIIEKEDGAPPTTKVTGVRA